MPHLDRRELLAGLAVAGAAILVPPASAADVPNIGSRRELFVDRLLIDKMDRTHLRLHEPRPAGTVFRFDRPWEGEYSGYTTILKDGDLYRMYYVGYSERAGHRICYAESRNGIDWKRPDLGQQEFAGSKKNNILTTPGAGESFAPFVDTRPGIAGDQRYKALAGSAAPLRTFVSGDGINWKQLAILEVKGAFDSHNLAFYSQAEDCYVLYFRTFHPKGGYRWVGRSTSKDFVKWTPTVQMDAGNSPGEQIYTSSTTPYFRAPHLYIALPSRFMAGRDVISEEQRKALGIAKGYLGEGAGFNDMPLMTSRGGNQYDRTFLETFIRPGIGPRNWTSRANYPAFGIVPTPDSDTCLSLYVNLHTGYATNHLARYTLRYDGFISVHAPFDAKVGPRGPFAEMLTKPFTFAGKRLSLNFATSAPGHLRVEIQDAAGKPIPGFSLEDCRWIVGDEIDRVVAWKKGSDMSQLAGRPVRLRFEMQATDLYAFQFVP